MNRRGVDSNSVKMASRESSAKARRGLTKVCNGARKASLTWLSYFCVARPLIPAVRPTSSEEKMQNCIVCHLVIIDF